MEKTYNPRKDCIPPVETSPPSRGNIARRAAKAEAASPKGAAAHAP